MGHLVSDKDKSALNAARKLGHAERDIITLGIALAAIIMFVGTGSSVVTKIVRAFAGTGLGPDRLLTNALLLNIALIIFGWRRYRELTGEVCERRRAEEQARVLAETDALTGCLNRRSIEPATDALIAASNQAGKAVAYAMLDLDKFKQINDVHGHTAGDLLLVTTVERIRKVLPKDSLLARIGGDEFALVVAFNRGQIGQIDDLIERVISAVAQPLELNGVSIESTISAGVISTEGQAEANAKALLHMADIAMYHSKKSGRNTYSWFDPIMESELRFQSEVESGLRHGIPAGEFVPYYEKQIDLGSGELVGFEMLARWNSPTHGTIGPDTFIPIAEEIGLISELSESLIRQAISDARNWDPKLTLSVNISPIQLRDPWFAQRLLKLLVEGNFPPSRFEIEITESALHENIGLVRSMITSLKNQGIRVSLDDFGTGYSSLTQLRSLPFDRIKIDRSFVTTLVESHESATIVQSIVSLGAGLGLPITAEGIENEEVLAALLRFGPLKGQGYYFGRPAPAEMTEAELAQLDLLLGGPELTYVAAQRRTDAA
jgi:diguanylate cyclase (GGDEF)-like protein